MKVDTGHYDCFNMELTEDEMESGMVRLDPYKVAMVWKLGQKDPSGCLFHMLKTMSRFGVKEGNSTSRELASLTATLERLVQLMESTVATKPLVDVDKAYKDFFELDEANKEILREHATSVHK